MRYREQLHWSTATVSSIQKWRSGAGPTIRKGPGDARGCQGKELRDFKDTLIFIFHKENQGAVMVSYGPLAVTRCSKAVPFLLVHVAILLTCFWHVWYSKDFDLWIDKNSDILYKTFCPIHLVNCYRLFISFASEWENISFQTPRHRIDHVFHGGQSVMPMGKHGTRFIPYQCPHARWLVP